jgi:predicted Zn-dependent peptidase
LAGNTNAASTNIRDSVNEYVLDNGMRILMSQRPGAPMISAGWVAHVGSANEQPGITGISHLFEHMMFKGSPRIGTRDNALDAQLRGELDDVRTQMFALERDYREQVRLGAAESINDPELQGEDMQALKQRFQELVEQQRANLIKDEFPKQEPPDKMPVPPRT